MTQLLYKGVYGRSFSKILELTSVLFLSFQNFGWRAIVVLFRSTGIQMTQIPPVAIKLKNILNIREIKRMLTNLSGEKNR